MWKADTGIQRFRDIRLENDILKPGEPYTEKKKAVLWPFKKPTLPTEFAKVRDAKSAIRFERRFAPLGYDQLVTDFIKERKDGDPIDWVLEHARFVRFALNLMWYLAFGREQELRKLIDSEKTGVLYPQGHDQITYPHGAYKQTLLLSHAGYTDKEIVWLTRTIVAMLVSDNTEKMHQVLEGGREELIWVRRFNGLIEAIWSMVGDLATKAEQQSEKEYFVRCEHCKEVFFSDDGRQRFCPPVEGQAGRRQSLCGLQYRQHKLQAKQKEAHSERTHS